MASFFNDLKSHDLLLRLPGSVATNQQIDESRLFSFPSIMLSMSLSLASRNKTAIKFEIDSQLTSTSDP